MSICNVVEVHYLNSSSDNKGETKTGKYTVDDLQIAPEDDSKVICSWLISRNATHYKGKLTFRLQFKCVEDDIISYAWNTAIFAEITISDGINADELWRYWDELCDIYGSQTVYDDINLIEDAVEGICDEEKVTWYTNVSRIKRKITDKLGKRAAEQYIIRRGENGMYRIDALLCDI